MCITILENQATRNRAAEERLNKLSGRASRAPIQQTYRKVTVTVDYWSRSLSGDGLCIHGTFWSRAGATS